MAIQSSARIFNLISAWNIDTNNFAKYCINTQYLNAVVLLSHFFVVTSFNNRMNV